MNVVNFGSLNLDHVYAVDHFCRAGETIHTAGYTQNAGGKGLNQSIAVARSGQTLCHAGMLGAGGEPLAQLLELGRFSGTIGSLDDDERTLHGCHIPFPSRTVIILFIIA